MSKLIRRSALVTEEHAGGNVSDCREYRPPLPLAARFLCFWTEIVSSQAEFPQRVLPDCCVDIILINETAVVVGPWTEFFVAHLPPGTKIVGARCYPVHVPNVLGIPASELLNQSVPLRDVWGRAEMLGLRASLRNRLFRQECRRWRQRYLGAWRMRVKVTKRRALLSDGLPGIRTAELTN